MDAQRFAIQKLQRPPWAAFRQTGDQPAIVVVAKRFLATEIGECRAQIAFAKRAKRQRELSEVIDALESVVTLLAP